MLHGFNYVNVFHLGIGMGKGIQMAREYQSHKFALEALVFALFSNTRWNDYMYAQFISNNSTTPYSRMAASLHNIVEDIRSSPYLSKEPKVLALYQSFNMRPNTSSNGTYVKKQRNSLNNVLIFLEFNFRYILLHLHDV